VQEVVGAKRKAAQKTGQRRVRQRTEPSQPESVASRGGPSV
jgi:hypothetical protein